MSIDIDGKVSALRKELDKLNHEFKVDLPKIIAHARAYGDLKENAEYHAARERQSFVKARISQLADQISQLQSIDISDISNDSISYGSKVTVVDLDSDDKIDFMFVSSNEVNPSEGKISLSSPIGIALRDKRVGETVDVSIPAGVRKYYIEKLVTIHGDEFEKGVS